MDDLRDRLSHVLWIGGAPLAGKTTLSRLLAGKYDLKIYNCDWHHVHEHRSRPAGVAPGWDEMSMDERWLRPTARELADRDAASWTARSRLVIEDLLVLPATRTIVAEGPSVFPWWVAPLVRSPRQGIWLVPTRELQESVLSRRHRDDPGPPWIAGTSDPARARRNQRDRDAILAERVVASCDDLGLRYVRLDGSLDLDDSLALLERHFAPHLPSTFNV
ncbi:MAG TPA: hypothetical protein VFM93_09510 [Candidatus Limnocylindria bacterium]|nr:hypothetical protein [Candidatus Limnocylindria bacterium]